MLKSFCSALADCRRCLFSNQVRFYYKANDGVLPRRESRRTLAKTRRELAQPTASSSQTVLLPPHVSPGELRILLGIDYKSALSLCGVKMYQQKYYWSDAEGRWFETANKRKVLVPFEQVAASVKVFGLRPVLVDPEPLLPVHPDAGRIPVIAVVGSSLAPFGATVDFPAGKATSAFNFKKATLVCVPSSASRGLAGRTVANADAVVLTSNASIDFDLEQLAVSRKIPILESPGADLHSVLSSASAALAEAVIDPSSHPLVDPLALQYRSEKKRTDVLVEAEKGPSASGVILDVEKSASQGTTALLLVKRGVVRVGQYFVAGSGFGKVMNVWSVDGEKVETATAGSVVKIGRIVKNKEYTGDFAPDDFLHVLPRERAWRLAFQRQRIEWLNSFQTSGRPLVAPFELDSGLVNRKTMADAVERSGPSRPATPAEWLRETGARESILVEPEPAEVKRAQAESAKVTARWTRRQELRKQAREDRERLVEDERMHLHKMRMMLHGKPEPGPEAGKPGKPTESQEEPQGLPERLPVIPVIVKTGSVSDFDSVLDELEVLERTFSVKLPVVHGGIGPVTATDIVHAEIESKYSPCRVFAVKTSVLPDIDSTSVAVFKSVEELVAEVRGRIVALKSRARRSAYAQTLGGQLR